MPKSVKIDIDVPAELQELSKSDLEIKLFKMFRRSKLTSFILSISFAFWGSLIFTFFAQLIESAGELQKVWNIAAAYQFVIFFVFLGLWCEVFAIVKHNYFAESDRIEKALKDLKEDKKENSSSNKKELSNEKTDP